MYMYTCIMGIEILHMYMYTVYTCIMGIEILHMYMYTVCTGY